VGDRQLAGWGYQILPFIEQQTVWSGEDGTAGISVATRQTNAMAAKVKVYYCTSRGLPRTSGARGLIDYAGATTSPAGVTTTNPTSAFGNADANSINNLPGTSGPKHNEGAIVRNLNTAAIVSSNNAVGSYVISLSGVRDGTSNTILIGEKQVNFNLIPGSADDDQGYASGWDIDNIRSCTKSPLADFGKPTDVNNDGSARGYYFGSSHPGIMNVVLCDGSVRSVTNTIDLFTFLKLCQRADSLPIGDY